MKKSEAYKLAQIAVVSTPTIAPESKLEVLALLIDAERFELFGEELEEKKNAETV